MALRIEKVTENFRDYDRLIALYARAFPANERRPLEPLVSDQTGHGEILAFYDGEVFCGFACLLTWQDISHIIHFAIDEKFRGHGYGTQALDAMRKMKDGCRMIADVETEREGALNNDQRRRRMAFYGRSGYEKSPVRYSWRDEEYVILVRGGTLTMKEFGNFWEAIEKADHSFSQY
jgi:GNAT superfamily N-acetyltransferase